MPSSSFGRLRIQIDQAMLLSQLDLRAVPTGQKQIFLHANLAALVSCWDAYVKSIAREFFDTLMLTSDINLIQSVSISKMMIESIIKRVNTLNFDNSRELILVCTGYDPYADWNWPSKNMSPQQVKIFLDEILSVRHSFAHGIAIKRFSWNEDRRGNIRLTKASINEIRSLFYHLAATTDRQLSASLVNRFSGTASW